MKKEGSRIINTSCEPNADCGMSVFSVETELHAQLKTGDVNASRLSFT